MSTSKNTNKISNDLWMARKRTGLQQKHVAYLLQHKTTAEVSRYEKGLRIPGLIILVQFEIIYGTPIKYLYPELYEQTRREISQRVQQHAHLAAKCQGFAKRVDPMGEFCAYLEMLEKPALAAEESAALRKHVLKMMRQLAGIQPNGAMK